MDLCRQGNKYLGKKLANNTAMIESVPNFTGCWKNLDLHHSPPVFLKKSMNDYLILMMKLFA